MMWLDNLMKAFCPESVKHKTLEELGFFYNGLTGKSKKDFVDGNQKFITYKNVFDNPEIDITREDYVFIGQHERQNSVQYGDILFTGSSETPDECAMSSVMTHRSNETFYLNSFTIGYRLNDVRVLHPAFSKHLFRSTNLRSQLIRTANGVTRFNVSKPQLAKVMIPVPPLQVQEEVARVLDIFTLLKAELEAELEARTMQYDYYRNALFNKSVFNCVFTNLGYTENELTDLFKQMEIRDVCISAKSGGTPQVSNPSYYGGEIPWLRTQEVDFNLIYDTDVKITNLGYKNSSTKWVPVNSVIVAMYGATAAKVAINKIMLTTNQACCNLEINSSVANYKYVFHWLSSRYEELKNLSEGAQPNLNMNKVLSFPIPVPPLPVQEAIVDILDRFEAIVHDIQDGLPAEIALRQKQYEYYRDQLLTFEPLETQAESA